MLEELKKKAIVKIDSHGAFGEYEAFYKLDPDKFAELLIKECCTIMEEHNSSILAEIVKERLGIK